MSKGRTTLQTASPASYLAQNTQVTGVQQAQAQIWHWLDVPWLQLLATPIGIFCSSRRKDESPDGCRKLFAILPLWWSSIISFYMFQTRNKGIREGGSCKWQKYSCAYSHRLIVSKNVAVLQTRNLWFQSIRISIAFHLELYSFGTSVLVEHFPLFHWIYSIALKQISSVNVVNFLFWAFSNCTLSYPQKIMFYNRT